MSESYPDQKHSNLDQLGMDVLRPSISGYVTLKRKDNWVRRYATINGKKNVFSYRRNLQDKEENFSINLLKSKIKKGLRNETQPYIFIQEIDDSNAQNNVVRVSFDQQTDFEKWMRIIWQAAKSRKEVEIQY